MCRRGPFQAIVLGAVVTRVERGYSYGKKKKEKGKEERVTRRPREIGVLA